MEINSKNTNNKNNLKDISELTTVRAEFNIKNIKLDSYNEATSFESKSNIIKNLLNDFNSSSNRMNLDNSSILDLYKIN